MKKFTLSYIFIMSVPYVAAISSLSGVGFWDLHYTGFIWLSVLVLGLLLILYHRGNVPFPKKLWLPWFGYVFLSVLWGGIHWRYNLQDPLQIVTPLVVGIVASFSIRTEDEIKNMIRGFKHCLLFITLAFIFFLYGPGASIQSFGKGYSVRPSAMTVAFIGCLFLSNLKRRPFSSIVGWTICLGITSLSASRMATFILLITLCAYPLYRKFMTRLLTISISCLIAVFLFHLPIFQQQFFTTGEGSLKQVLIGDFSGSGRFEEVWPVVWKEAKRNIVFGAGAGEIGRFAKKASLSVGTPLNDYLRIVFEYGMFGLVLFLNTVLIQIFILHKMIRSYPPTMSRLIVAAYLGFLALMFFCITENALIYGVHFTNPLFAVLGAVYGVTRHQAEMRV